MYEHTSEPVTWTATVKYPKRQRCTNRKRFIKLLMAEGISRNKANKAAGMVQSMSKDLMWQNVSYQSYYTLSKLFGVFDDMKED